VRFVELKMVACYGLHDDNCNFVQFRKHAGIFQSYKSRLFVLNQHYKFRFCKLMFQNTLLPPP
jgi:hypothetical protein